MPFAGDGMEGSPGQEPPGKSSHKSGLPCALHTVIHPQFNPTFQIAYFFLGGVAIVTISQITHIRNHSVTQFVVYYKGVGLGIWKLTELGHVLMGFVHSDC
jgi:hypothetical protein